MVVCDLTVGNSSHTFNKATWECVCVCVWLEEWCVHVCAYSVRGRDIA